MQHFTSIDRINNKILRELSADGRMSNVELAERVGLSPSACLRRVQELENSGVIKGYRVQLDGAKLGLSFMAYVAVGLSDHSAAAQKRFERVARQSDEIVECHNITGEFEYLLRVEVSDMRAYKQFHSEVLGSLTQVNRITTFVMIDSAKDERA